MQFTLVQNAGHFAYEYVQNGERLAEITWTEKEGVMYMDHTYVSDQLRGQGVARKLLDVAADYARTNQLKMQAICSYVVAVFEKSDAYADVKTSK